MRGTCVPVSIPVNLIQHTHRDKRVSLPFSLFPPTVLQTRFEQLHPELTECGPASPGCHPERFVQRGQLALHTTVDAARSENRVCTLCLANSAFTLPSLRSAPLCASTIMLPSSSTIIRQHHLLWDNSFTYYHYFSHSTTLILTHTFISFSPLYLSLSLSFPHAIILILIHKQATKTATLIVMTTRNTIAHTPIIEDTLLH